MSETKTSSSSSSGIGASGLLGVVFVTLKLLHIINWSWWWVTAPFWGGLAILIMFAVLVFIGAGSLIFIANWIDSRRLKKLRVQGKF